MSDATDLASRGDPDEGFAPISTAETRLGEQFVDSLSRQPEVHLVTVLAGVFGAVAGLLSLTAADAVRDSPGPWWWAAAVLPLGAALGVALFKAYMHVADRERREGEARLMNAVIGDLAAGRVRVSRLRGDRAVEIATPYADQRLFVLRSSSLRCIAVPWTDASPNVAVEMSGRRMPTSVVELRTLPESGRLVGLRVGGSSIPIDATLPVENWSRDVVLGDVLEIPWDELVAGNVIVSRHARAT